MNEIVESRVFPFSARLCFERLLVCLSDLEMTLLSQSPDDNSLTAFWMHGQIRYSFRVEFLVKSPTTCEMRVLYCPELTPTTMRPVMVFGGATIKEIIRAKFSILIQRLRLSLGEISQAQFTASLTEIAGGAGETKTTINRKARNKEGGFSIGVGLLMLLSAAVMHNEVSIFLGAISILVIVSGITILLLGDSAPWAIKTYKCPACGERLPNPPDPGIDMNCPKCGKRLTRSGF